MAILRSFKKISPLERICLAPKPHPHEVRKEPVGWTRKLVDSVVMYTLAEARKMLPDAQGCQIILDQVQFSRWQITYPGAAPPVSVSRLNGTRRSVTRNHALFYCLKKVSAWYKEAAGGACPYDISDLQA